MFARRGRSHVCAVEQFQFPNRIAVGGLPFASNLDDFCHPLVSAGLVQVSTAARDLHAVMLSGDAAVSCLDGLEPAQLDASLDEGYLCSPTNGRHVVESLYESMFPIYG